MSKYTEIFKLKRMLEEANIPFVFIDASSHFSFGKENLEHYIIHYPTNDEFWISVAEGFNSYGNEKDELEIMGGLTPYEKFTNLRKEYDVVGYFTAKNVFKRIQDHYERNKYYYGKKG